MANQISFVLMLPIKVIAILSALVLVITLSGIWERIVDLI